MDKRSTESSGAASLWHTGDPGLDATLDALPVEVNAASLHQRVLRDTCKRARLGAPLYLLLWLTITTMTGLMEAEPRWVFINAAAFAVTGVGRLLLCRFLGSLLPHRYTLANGLFLALTLTNALQWGALTVAAGVVPELRSIEPYMVLSLVALTMAGAMGMSIHRGARTWFPVAIVMPMAASLPFLFTPQRALVAVLGALFAIYVAGLSRMLARDYWRMLTASALLKRRALQLTELSHTDGLTTLRNRLYFDKQFKQEWLRAYRQQQPIALLLLDLDRFKSINDRHGHPFGDECLRVVARALSHEIQRTADVAARFGGEEFIVMLADTDLAGASAVAERVLAALRNIDLRVDGQRIMLTASIGIASAVPDHPALSQRLIQQADEALYRAKHGGRDQAVCSAWADLADDTLKSA